MQFKEPKTIFLAETTMCYGGLLEMLREIGAPNWATDEMISGGEELVEVAGRMCYKSFGAGLNPNVTKVRDGNRNYIGNVLKSGHGSVLEHSSFTIAFLNVSRVFTHEIVRHRAGTAFSQESLRYVRLTDLTAYLPKSFDEEDKDMMADFFNQAEDIQRELARKYNMDNEKNFDFKKAMTSAFRRLAPIGLSTNIIVTGNHRSWRHMLAMRASRYAEEEIRSVMYQLAIQVKARFPNLYQDMRLDPEHEEVTFENRKV